MNTDIQNTDLYKKFIKALDIHDMRIDDNPFVVKCCEVAKEYANVEIKKLTPISPSHMTRETLLLYHNYYLKKRKEVADSSPEYMVDLFMADFPELTPISTSPIDEQLLKKAWEAGRSWQIGENAEYNGGGENERPDFKEWLKQNPISPSPVMSIEEFKKDPVNTLLVNAMKYLDEEQMIALRDSLSARLPKVEVTDEEILEKSEELWDKYSEYIGSNISDLGRWADVSVISIQEFYKAVRDLLTNKEAK